MVFNPELPINPPEEQGTWIDRASAQADAQWEWEELMKQIESEREKECTSRLLRLRMTTRRKI